MKAPSHDDCCDVIHYELEEDEGSHLPSHKTDAEFMQKVRNEGNSTSESLIRKMGHQQITALSRELIKYLRQVNPDYDRGKRRLQCDDAGWAKFSKLAKTKVPFKEQVRFTDTRGLTDVVTLFAEFQESESGK